MTKYVFVTGGVVSSVGKGITVASLGRLLKYRGLEISVMKLDPYLNVDPGTMSPYQHGEVFVTKDGCETDLDLGHYERFIDLELTASSNVTAGQIYSSVIQKERRGDYLGGTIQVVPQVTDEIKNHIKSLAKESQADVVVVEVGGTVGDIEGLPFLEAIRQIRHEVGRENVYNIHVTLLPFIQATGEIKTKPTQHSVKELRSIGIQPDAIIARSDFEVSNGILDKIALFCDVQKDSVVVLPTVRSIYEVPLFLKNSGIDTVLTKHLQLDLEPSFTDDWENMVTRMNDLKKTTTIGVVGKYTDLPDAYISVKEALNHAGIFNDTNIKIEWIQSEEIEKLGCEPLLSNLDGIVVPGGFGIRGIEGMIKTAQYSRINKIPYLGLCLGMQMMVIEVARNVLGLDSAHSTEFEKDTKDPVICLMDEQKDVVEKGGTMRLGNYPCQLNPESYLNEIYGVSLINERHRHRYEFNNQYRNLIAEGGLIAQGTSPDGELVEICQLDQHPFMIGVQFHPEFLSRPQRPHPLFKEFISIAKKGSK
jgi:CTP synthase